MKIRNKAKKALMVLPLLLVALVVPARVAAGLGVSPADITNEHMKPGSTYEKTFTISRSEATEDVQATVTTEFDDGIDDWFSFDPGRQITLSAGEERTELKVTVTVPSDAELGEYSGFIRVILGADEVEGAVAIAEGVRIDANIKVTNEDYIELMVRLLDVEEAYSQGRIKMLVRTENKGNMVAGPSKVVMEVQSLAQEHVATLETTDVGTADPGEIDDLYATFASDHGLEAGEYFAQTSVYYSDQVLRQELLSFEVIEGGEPDVETEDGLIGEDGISATTLYVVAGIVAVGLAVGVVVLLVLKSKKEEVEKKQVR